MAEDYAHSHYYYRHKGRVAKYRELVKQAGAELSARRVKSRAASSARALKHYHILQALEREIEQEKQRCQLCDIVKAEAFGLGHGNWIQRQCSQCFAMSAERSARLRHMGLPVDPSPHEDHTDALLFRIVASEQRLSILGGDPGQGLITSPSEPHHSRRSARVDQHSSPVGTSAGIGTHQGTAAASKHGAEEVYMAKNQAICRQADVIRSTGAAVPTSDGLKDHGLYNNSAAFDVAAETAEESSASSSQDSGPKNLTSLPRIKDFNTRSEQLQPSGIPKPSLLRPSEEQTPSIYERVQDLMQSLRKGDKRALLEGLLSSEDIEGLLEEILPQPEPFIGNSLVESSTTDTTMVQNEAPEIRKTALEKLRDELKQAEQSIAFAPTQEERCSALHLAFDLRRGLAELNGLERKEQRAKTMQVGRLSMMVSISSYVGHTALFLKVLIPRHNYHQSSSVSKGSCNAPCSGTRIELLCPDPGSHPTDQPGPVLSRRALGPRSPWPSRRSLIPRQQRTNSTLGGT